jgi:hypothetical protein
MSVFTNNRTCNKNLIGDMAKKENNELEKRNQAFLIYQDENGIARVNVRFEGEDVKATIKDQLNAPLLLGQSAIEKLGKVTIDGYKLIIHRE